MTYELAKQLRAAGFKQMIAGDGYFRKSTGEYLYGFYDSVYFPTLSELIEACGVPFRLVCYTAEAWNAGDKVTSDGHLGHGSTPEEAVARLWLALHE